jgi:Sec-independent protein translocase protein TatA
LGGRGRWISEFKGSLVCRVSSRTARATQRNPVLKKPKPKQQQKKKTNKKKKDEISRPVSHIKYSETAGCL